MNLITWKVLQRFGKNGNLGVCGAPGLVFDVPALKDGVNLAQYKLVFVWKIKKNIYPKNTIKCPVKKKNVHPKK